MKPIRRIIRIVVLSLGTLVCPVVAHAQLGGILGGLVQAATERWIDKSNYSSKDKETMRNAVNYLSNEINANQGARDAAKNAYEGNYTGALLQGAQTVLNATGNSSSDTYLNSANAINDANREYNLNIQNGMDPDEALRIRNEKIGNSAAESIVELQDRLAREKIRKAREKRELERQSWESSNDYTSTSYNETTSYSGANARTSVSNQETFEDALIAHINTTNVINAMPEMITAGKELESYSNELQNQYQAMLEEFQTKYDYYKSNNTTMSNSIKQMKENELVSIQNRIQQFQEDAKRELETKRTELMTPIYEKLQNAIQSVARDNMLTAVFDTNSILFYGEEAIDITFMIMKELGIQ